MISAQTGRSMVEMLGTLAIMGVLTIGGIAGYRYAINKSNANTILNAVSQMAVTASTELTTQGSLTLPEWKDSTGNIFINEAYGVVAEPYNDGSFGLIVSDIPNEVCERIKGMDWKLPEDILINDTDNCDADDDNEINFIFSGTLNNNGNRDGEGNCRKGYTGPDCADKIECQNGGIWTPQGCECPDGLYGAACDTDCNGFKNQAGTCYSCNVVEVIHPTTETECNRCANRTLYKNRLCGLTECPNELPVKTVYGRCVKCNFSPYGSYQTTKEECDKGPGCYWSNSWCYTCDSYASNRATQSECDRCPNRIYTTGGYCALPCVSDEQIMSANGGCYTCDEITSVSTSKEECNKCSDHIYSNKTCYSCDVATSITTNETECHKCPNRIYIDNKCVLDCRTDEKPIMNTSGNCYACDTTAGILTDSENCAKCSNRKMNNEGTQCILNTCPTIVSIRNKTGGCLSCSSTGIFRNTAQDECAKCKDLGTPRFSNSTGSICYLCSYDNGISGTVETCSMCNGTDNPRFMGTDEKCYPCNYEGSVSVNNESECAKCGELRIYDTETGKCNPK